MILPKEKVVKIKVWTTPDNKEFPSYEEAKHHAESLDKIKLKFNEFSNSYFGKLLLKGNNLQTIATWEIRGEGPADFSSASNPPYIATVYGSLEKAINYAINNEKFWGYGPGTIKKIDIIDLGK